MALVPKNKPMWDREKVEKFLHDRGVTDPVALLGVRGYYRDSMGKVGQNDRGLYDDAIFVLMPNLCFSFNANTDPSRFREGIAVLQEGLYEYKIGIHGLNKPEHQRYKALVQAGPVIVQRDTDDKPETLDYKHDDGWFGINIHRGGENGTSSLGCQTITPSQWQMFFDTVSQAMERNKMKKIYYLLIQQQG